jgi:transcriptional regulator with PAS, ATPase and Fis domain
VEQQLIEDALGVYGNTYKAAEALGIDQSTLIRKKAKYKKMIK